MENPKNCYFAEFNTVIFCGWYKSKYCTLTCNYANKENNKGLEKRIGMCDLTVKMSKFFKKRK